MVATRLSRDFLGDLSRLLVGLLVAAALVVFPTSTPASQAIQADGSDSVIDYSVAANSNAFYASSGTLLTTGTSFTFEAWVKPNSQMLNNVDHVIVSKHYEYAIAINSGEWVYWVGSAGNWGTRFFTGVKVVPGAWTHVALVLDGTTGTFYVNGNQAHETSSRDKTYEPTAAFTIAGWESFAGILDAEIDEVKVWSTNRALNLSTDMHTRAAANEAGLVAYWDFNEGSGSTIHDRTGNFNLTAVNSPIYGDVKQVSGAPGGDTVITFPRTYLPGVGGWSVPDSVTSIDALIVGAGGAGAARNGGGGGGGAVVQVSGISATPSATVSVKVGSGGLRGAANASTTDIRRGFDGQASTLSNNGAATTAAGGSRAGNGSGDSLVITGGTSGNGNLGGSGLNAGCPSGLSTDWCAGGGGGAGGVGLDANASNNTGGDGGPGLSFSITGTSIFYGGGGGGGTDANLTAGTGGSGGGGNGSAGVVDASDGSPNTGGGGGGGGYNQNEAIGAQDGSGGSGGSGVIIVRYTPTQDQAFVASATDLMTGTSVIPTANNAAFTMEAWVYPTNLTGWRGILNQSPTLRDGTQRTSLLTLDGIVYVMVNEGSFINTGFKIYNNEWTHIGVAVSGSGASGLVEIYVNGQLISSTSAYNRLNTTGTVFHLGGTHVATEYWVGQIDQVKIWQGALSAADVALSMHTYSSSGIISAALQSLYDFNEFNPGVEPNRVTNQLALSVSKVVSETNYTTSSIIETGSAGSSNFYYKFNRSYLTAAGGWVKPSNVSKFQALMVAGGGGGGAWVGAGGGAGGFTESSSITISASTVRIEVGAGGAGGKRVSNTSTAGSNGQPSTLSALGQATLFVQGGGRGAGWAPGENPGVGGSGGGGNGSGSSDNNWAGATGISGQGSSGGNGQPNTQWATGGGGGAGGAGGTGSGYYAGDGGNGLQSSITGVNTYYAGGGGGGYHGNNAGNPVYYSISTGAASNSAGTGGLGGGGNGGQPTAYSTVETVYGGNGVAGTGGGGGGAGKAANLDSTGGNGGSGVVILSYSLAPDAPTSLTATQTTTHATVNLSWTAPTYPGNSAITDYLIEYKPAGGSWSSYSDGVSTATNASVELPTQCVSHEFRVIAKNSSFDSAASATASATPVWGTFQTLAGVQIGSTNSECVVTFTTPGTTTWTSPADTEVVRGLVVGGGGGGGGYQFGGGGGAGGVILGDNFRISASSAITVKVGAGGTGGADSTTAAHGGSGGNSQFADYIASGGGGGASFPSSQTPGSGGSTGGKGAYSSERSIVTQSLYIGLLTFGNPGGSVTGGASGGGGGGAGGAGLQGSGSINSSLGGDGGPGITTTMSGVAKTFAAGGGGGGDTGGNPGHSSAGRGGFRSPQNVAPLSAQANSGSGGGGTGQNGPAAAGGSGIVIIRQLSIAAPTVTSHPSNASTQPGVPVTLTVAATGNGALSYQWESSTDGNTWTSVGTNSSTFTTPSLTTADDGIQYRVAVTNTLNGQTSSVTSNLATISVAGVTITSGNCSAMVGSDTGVTISETANGACLVKYTTPGNNTFFVPNLVSSIQAYIVGGGGGGGGAKLSEGGGGGGGGGASRLVTLQVTTSQVIPLTVAAGGAGGNANANGSNGGSSVFSSSYTVPGGEGGETPTSWPGGGGNGGTGATGQTYVSSGFSGGNGATDPGDRSFYQPKYGGGGSWRSFAGELWCVGGGGGGGNREVANDAYFQWEPRSATCSNGVGVSGGSGGWHNGTTNVLPTPGVANTGGGGGGGSYDSSLSIARAGADGADGLVAIYFVPGTGDISLSSVNAASYSGTTHTINLTKDNPSTNVTWTTSNSLICTVTGNASSATVTEVAAGLCEVSVVIAAISPYARGSAATSFQIDKISRTVPTWINSSVNVPYGTTLDLRPKLANPGSDSFTFSTSGTANSCSVTGSTLTVGSVGDTCNVTPTLLGTAIYQDMVGNQALSVTVTKISQSSIVITSARSMNVNQTLTVSAAGGSGAGALSYHVAAQGTTNCSINSSTGALTASASGDCEVYAQRASSANFDAVTSSHVVVAVNKISQNLSWVSQPQAQYVSGNTYALEATASSQLTVAYSISAGLCTLSGSTVTFTGSGDCVIQAGQAGDGSYFEALTISQTVSVGKINQTITFSAIADKAWGSLAFSLSATVSSGLAIAYSKSNQTTNDSCDVSVTGIVTVKNVGTCAITATQVGNTSYTSVAATRIFAITANQAGAPFIGSVSFGDRQLNASFFTPSYLGGGTVSAYEMRAYELDGTLASTNTGCIASLGATQSCSVAGLDNGKKYVLRVAAITQAGLGQFSASSSEIIPAANPEAVGNLIAIEGNGSLALQWTQPTSFGGGSFFQYRIYWRAPGQQYQADGSPGATVGAAASTSINITGLANGVAYDVKIVTATSNNNVELQSNTAEVRQTPYTVPDAPAAVVALDNASNLIVAWQPPQFDGGNPIDQYVVTKDGSTVCTITSASTTSCEVAKPSAGSSSLIEVKAGNDAGLSLAASTSVTIQAVLNVTNPVVIGGGTVPVSKAPGSIAVSGSSVVSTNELLRITGTNLDLVQRVLIGDQEASFFINSDGLLTVRIPANLAAGAPILTLFGTFGSRAFANLIEIKESVSPGDSKITIGTFLGFAAVYTKNHEGKRLSIRIGDKWRVIKALPANYTYNLTKVGKGKTVTVMVYVDRVLAQVQQLKVQ